MANRILVVDDHDVVRQGVLLILRSHPEWEIVGEASDGIEAIAKAKSLVPELVILDVSMPRKDGLEVLEELIELKISSRIIVLTMHDSKELSVALRKAGASGYVVKTQAARDLVPAVQAVLAGGTFFPPALPLDESSRSERAGEPNVNAGNQTFQKVVELAKLDPPNRRSLFSSFISMLREWVSSLGPRSTSIA